MAPRNRKPNSFSKAGARSIPVKKASAKESGAKKSNTVVPPPPSSSPALPRAAQVLKMRKRYFNSHTDTKVVGVYEEEEQTYAVGIRQVIFKEMGGKMPELRKITHMKTLPLKQRIKDIIKNINGLYYEKWGIKMSKLIPAEAVDDNKLLDGLISDDDCQCEGSDGGGSDDKESDLV